MKQSVFGFLVFILLALPAQASTAADALPLVQQRSCFTRFATYDQWMDSLWEKNNLLAYLALRWKYSEDDFSRYASGLDCRAISYRSDAHTVMGFIVMPKAHPDRRKLPVIVFNRGGNGVFGALTLADLLEHVFPLAEQGYVVMASQYRGVPGPAAGERSPDQFGGDDVRDVTRLLDLVQQLPEADKNNVFMLGQSRGAIMTFRALLDSPLPVRAVAIHSGAFDMHDLLAFRPEFERLFTALVPDFATRRQEALDHRSVTRWPERLPAETAVLIVHGDEDERAPLGSARKFAEQLRKLGRTHEFVVLEGESHSLAGAREDVRTRTLAWFRRFEQPGSPTASLRH